MEIYFATNIFQLNDNLLMNNIHNHTPDAVWAQVEQNGVFVIFDQEGFSRRVEVFSGNFAVVNSNQGRGRGRGRGRGCGNGRGRGVADTKLVLHLKQKECWKLTETPVQNQIGNIKNEKLVEVSRKCTIMSVG